MDEFEDIDSFEPLGEYSHFGQHDHKCKEGQDDAEHREQVVLDTAVPQPHQFVGQAAPELVE